MYPSQSPIYYLPQPVRVQVSPFPPINYPTLSLYFRSFFFSPATKGQLEAHPYPCPIPCPA